MNDDKKDTKALQLKKANLVRIKTKIRAGALRANHNARVVK